MSDNFYYLKQPIPLDSVYEIKYFTKGFQVDWSDIGNKGFAHLQKYHTAEQRVKYIIENLK